MLRAPHERRAAEPPASRILLSALIWLAFAPRQIWHVGRAGTGRDNLHTLRLNVSILPGNPFTNTHRALRRSANSLSSPMVSRILRTSSDLVAARHALPVPKLWEPARISTIRAGNRGCGPRTISP